MMTVASAMMRHRLSQTAAEAFVAMRRKYRLAQQVAA